MKGVKTSIIILYFLILFLLGWLSYACYCNLKFDANSSAGLIVSALCVLVTALVGWQIFNAISIQRRLTFVENKTYRMPNDIRKVKKDIEMSSKSSNDMTIGAIRLSSALTLFYNTINDGKSDDLKIRSYIRCYALSAGALAKFLNLSNDSEAQIIFNEVCLQILNGSSKRIFKTISVDNTYSVFDKNTHQKCNNHYLNIIKQYEKLNESQQKIIETNHLKRTSLLLKPQS